MPARWYPDWDSFRPDPGVTDGPVAFSADLSPEAVLGAYRHGIVPFPAPDEYHRTLNEVRYEEQVAGGVIGLVGAGPGGGRDPYAVAWWSPDPRPVIAVDRVHLGRNVRKRLRRGHQWTTADTAFEQVAEQCRVGREPRWLTDPLLESLIALHEKGWAHSVEVWEGGELIDAQWDSPFLRSLGTAPMARAEYVARLTGPAERLMLPREPEPAERLLRLGAGVTGVRGGLGTRGGWEYLR